MRRGELRPGRKHTLNAAAHLFMAEVLLARFRRLTENEFGKGTTPERSKNLASVILNDAQQHLNRAAHTAKQRLVRERAAQLLALCAEAEGRVTRAVELLWEVIKRNASWALESQIRNRLGDLLLTSGRYADSAKVYASIPENSGEWRTRARLGLAWARHRRGDDRGAMRAIAEVRRDLQGLFERSAQVLSHETDRLYVQLMAEGDYPLDSLPPHIAENVRALKFRLSSKGEGDAQVAKDGRRSAVLGRFPKLRSCYRKLLHTSPNTTGMVQIIMNATTAPAIVRISLGQQTFRRCITTALADVAALPTDRTAIMTINFVAQAQKRGM